MANIHNAMLTFAITISTFGLCTVFLLALNPPTSEEFPMRKPLVGSIFSLICILGMIAAFCPKQCSRMSHFRKEKPKILSSERSSNIKGHHPTCGKFSAHIIPFRNYVICAACAGLTFGALIALVGGFLYFFTELYIFNNNFITVIIGIMGLIFGFFQLKFKGIFRLVSNLFFVVGAFLILIGIDKLAKGLVVDLFVIMLILFWLYTRILLSKWDHSQICRKCTAKCKIVI